VAVLFNHAAIVDGAGEIPHVHVCLDEPDAGLEDVVPDGIWEQIVRGVIGGRENGEAPPEDMIEQAGEESGVAGVVDVELVEEEQTAVPGDVVDRAFDSVSFDSVIVDVAVQFVEEAMEMHAGLLCQRELCVEGVSEPRLASTGLPMNVEAPRRRLPQRLAVEIRTESCQPIE
jgi:hypothetical protein